MMRNSRYMLLMLLLLVTASIAFSQNEKPAIKIVTRVSKKSIKLRWAPNTPTTWQLCNKYGYTIDRIKMLEKGRKMAKPERTTLNNQPIKPVLQNFWEPHMDDDYVAVAAQAIYGETFELSDDYKSDIVKVVNKAKELETRFSFALFACDQSLKAAQLSGLYFEDESVAEGEKYLYRIYANIPAAIQKVDTGFVYLGLEDFEELPKPKDLRVNFEDHVALLSWNGALFDKIYNSFWVERSEDKGRTFARITKDPVINAYQGTKPKTPLIFKVDSLPANDKVYHYRVMGINAFGEIGPPSDTVSGSGKPVFAYSASIIKHEITSDGKVKLEWTFPAEGESMLKSFDLIKINQTTKVQSEIKKQIGFQTRVVIDDSPSTTNYYVIRSVDKYGRTNNSFPYLVQTEDSIPPSAPVELSGRIDTLGRVYITWRANSEEDLLGYSLYKANFISDEFIQKPGPIFTESQYVDTVKLNTLTEKIYYKVRAVDKRFNASEFSVALALEKPDKMPPVPPAFRSINSDSAGVNIAWNNSGSEDVIEHLLYRKTESEAEWTLIKTFNSDDSVTAYRDQFVKHRVRYAYTMLAVDDDGLESSPSEPLAITYIASNPYPTVENIFYSIDKTKKSITLSWRYDHELVDKFMIYRSDNDEPLKLYKSVDKSVTEIKDEYNLNDIKVEYRIVVGFKTGERTRSSKALIVKI
jgi:fibronectin type 3 domain-containing protein